MDSTEEAMKGIVGHKSHKQRADELARRYRAIERDQREGGDPYEASRKLDELTPHLARLVADTEEIERRARLQR